MKVASHGKHCKHLGCLGTQNAQTSNAKTDEDNWDKWGHHFDEDITSLEELLGKLLPSGELGNIE
jgi:hypothetical protein